MKKLQQQKPLKVKPSLSRKKEPKNYLVLRDTREHKGKGWFFEKHLRCLGTRETALKTGDYTIEGYEDLICIERKGSISEFANNLLQKRFEAELKRMVEFPVAFVILEFDFEDFMNWPHSAGIPKSTIARMKMNSSVLLRKFLELQTKYPNIHYIFAGDHGKSYVLSLFKRVIDGSAAIRKSHRSKVSAAKPSRT